MAYELRQELKLTQSLVMTPQLQMAIKLLQLSRLELVETIREEVQQNPVLEETVDTDSRDSTPAEPEKPTPEVDWQSYLEGQEDHRSYSVNFSDKTDPETDIVGNISSPAGGLKDHLVWQLRMSGLKDSEVDIGEFIIGNIDSDGYLRAMERGHMTDGEFEAATIEEISRHTDSTPEEAALVHSRILHFDPLGAGARTLRECLLTQARGLGVRDTVMEEIISNHLERLGRKDFKAIARDLGVSVEDVVEAARNVNKNLNPTPGSGFGADESRAIVPDVFINKVGDDYVISLNEDGLPKLRVSRYYRNLLKEEGNGLGDAKSYIQDKLKSALWLMKSVHQRQRTIYRVVECIVKFQKEFLDKGLKFLRPMVLKDVAEEIGVHESTVSRVTSNKYVQTPRGIFELKYFFSTGMSKSDGEDTTVEYIKEKLGEIIKGEDPKNPYSDQQLVELLAKSGIQLARRTAAKYREALGVPSSSRRKVRY